MKKFDSDSFIKGLEEIYGVEELPLDYEDYEDYMEAYDQITERDFKNDL